MSKICLIQSPKFGGAGWTAVCAYYSTNEMHETLSGIPACRMDDLNGEIISAEISLVTFFVAKKVTPARVVRRDLQFVDLESAERPIQSQASG